MPDNALPTNALVRVWIQPASIDSAGNATFPFGWAWTPEPRLIARRASCSVGSMGAASFDLIRRTRQEGGNPKITLYTDQIVSGQYVCITGATDPRLADPTNPLQASDSLDPSAILWLGYITALTYEQFTGTTDGIGTVTARELGHLLDQQQVTGWRRATADGGYGEPINNPPTANMGSACGQVIGNAVQVGNFINSTPGFAFARLPGDCSQLAANLFTRWRLLWHVVYGLRQPALPTLALSCTDGSEAVDPGVTSQIAGYLNDTSVPEVFDLRNLTYKGAIDMCAPRSRGFGWRLVPSFQFGGSPSLKVVIHSYADTTAYGLPVNNYAVAIDTTAEPILSVNVTKDVTDLPDAITVEGAPILVAATVGFPDSSLAIGWKRGDSQQEGLYKTAASGASDYANLTADQRIERNQMVRQGPGLRDVYSRYGLFSYSNGDVTMLSPPGDGTGAPVPLVPNLQWTGVQIIASDTPSRVPYLPTANIARIIPWPEGLKTDGTDLRDPVSQASPQYLQMKVFRYMSSDPFFKWIDLTARNGRPGYPSLHVDVDERGAAIRIIATQNEILAKNHWRDTIAPAIADIDPDFTAIAIDYTTLVTTIAIESDQKVSVTKYRPGISGDSVVRKRLVLRDDNLQCWAVRVGTIIGVKSDGTPDRVTSGGSAFPLDANGKVVLTRNDFPVAERRAAMAAAWAFRKRVAIDIARAKPGEWPGPYQPGTSNGYAVVGALITSIGEGAGVNLAVNTVVEQVDMDFSTAQPQARISTSLPGALGFAPVLGGAGGGGAAAGGGVSVGLGGTHAQAIQTLQQGGNDIQRADQRTPVIIPRTFPYTPVLVVRIDQGNTLASGQLGIKYSSSAITSAPSAYNPNVDTTYIDGIGRGILYRDGIQQPGYVLVLNDSTCPLARPLVQDDLVSVAQQVPLTIGAGPAAIGIYRANFL